MPKRRLVIAGFGDSGLTAAVHLAADPDLEIVGITPKPCHQSGQELGGRLAQPATWEQLYLLPFQSYKRLDNVRIVQGLVTAIALEQQRVVCRLADGTSSTEPYDALLIASGCSNGFWRTTAMESRDGIRASIAAEHNRVAAAATVAVVGAGPSGVSAAFNVARRFPGKTVHLFCSRDQVLPGYHRRTVGTIRARLVDAGVVIHYGHRAVLPDGFAGDTMTAGPIAWGTGQADTVADLVVWACGMVRPNSSFVPPELLDDRGFVKVDEYLRAAGRPEVFALGDIAASDEMRSTARNDGWKLVGGNIRAFLAHGHSDRGLTKYSAPSYRWGSILGPWEGQELFFSTGIAVWVPLWLWRRFWHLVQHFLWGGMRNEVDWSTLKVPDPTRGV